MSTLYEVALVGEFFQTDLQVILNRFTLHSEFSQRMHSREVIFEPIDAAAQRAANVGPIKLRCRKELLEPGSGWYVYCCHILHILSFDRVMFSHLKPETARVQGASEATIRPAVTSQVTGDALSFASALGYVYASLLMIFLMDQRLSRRTIQVFKRGYIFRRGPLSIQMFQMDNVHA